MYTRLNLQIKNLQAICLPVSIVAASDLRQVILTSHRNKLLRRAVPRRSDHSPDAQFIPWTIKSHPGHSSHSLDGQITPHTLRLQVLLVHFDG